jgi:hypothetical protein
MAKNKLKTKYQLKMSLTFEIDAESFEEAQDIASQKILSGQVKIAAENDIKLLDITGQIKAV